MTPDAELATIELLKLSESLAALVDGRIHARLPQGVTYPAIRVQALGGVSLVRRHLDAATIQISAFGPATDKAALRNVIDAAREALDDAENVITSSAVVTGVDTAPPIWLPDDQPQLSSYVLTAVVVVHPIHA
jgi:hypothetical protein